MQRTRNRSQAQPRRQRTFGWRGSVLQLRVLPLRVLQPRVWQARALVLTLALTALLAVGCGGGETETPSGGEVALADRLLRAGESAFAAVETFDRTLPPDLSALLNPTSNETTPPEMLISLPVHPDGTLLGSFQLRRADGSTLMWIVYDLDTLPTDVLPVVESQMNETPWQVVGGQSDDGLSAVRFRSSVSSDVDGTVIIQAMNATDDLPLTVERDGESQVLSMPRGSSIPVIPVELDEDDDGIEVSFTDRAATITTGLEAGDRLVQVGETPVSDLTELAEAMRTYAEGTNVKTTLVYIMEVRPTLEALPPVFTLPAVVEPPVDFPASFLLGDGMWVLNYSWQLDEAGRFYQLVVLTEDSSASVARSIRDAVEAEGWEITTDEARGFATVMEFANEDAGIVASVSVDEFEADTRYTGILLQVQTSRGGVN